ncbi:hypothetical protein ACFU6I_00305 [Streptomyces sp. NPDC057486]|uniref:hypothetical protein n=1 Tax=Streptomyces sp. NPDC057486 TaxID=3346145 RepID=UPI00368B3F1E
MNDTEQLPAAVEKTAHTTPRWERYPLPAAPSTQDIARAEATLGFAVDCRTERTTVLLLEPNADEPQHARYIDRPDLATWLRAWLDGAGWYGEDADDEAMDHPQPWPDYNTRI